MNAPRTLLATSIGPGKEYVGAFLSQVIEALEGVTETARVIDGIDFPYGQRGRLTDHQIPLGGYHSPLSIHGRLARMREATRRFFLHGGWSHIYWHDSDMLPPQDIIPRLLAHNAPVVSGVYAIRGSTEPCLALSNRVYDPNDPHEQDWDEIEIVDGLARVVGVGFGCLLMTREVVEAVPFREPTSLPPEGPGEDIAWCWDYTAKFGEKPLVDMRLECGHVDSDGMAIVPRFHWDRIAEYTERKENDALVSA